MIPDRLKALRLLAACLLPVVADTVHGADRDEVLGAMKRATVFMVERVSHEGGYVRTYLPDFSRRWGEMEAYPTMIWIQGTTPGMGALFLDAYRATGDEYYYQAAARVGDVLIRVQHPSGGWNYVADLAGEASLRRWYETIGRDGWRLEEFHHYYGNATFDDGTTTGAARFMLQLYFARRDSKYKASADKAIQFVLDAQYPCGGWPQRYPLMDGFTKDGQPDYTGFITFNDDVAIGNIDFLIECNQLLGEERLQEPIRRAMNSFIVTQHKSPQAGWAMQYTPDLKPAGARTYEPKALVTHTTGRNISQLIRFYRLTGDTNFLTRIPEALDWLDSVKWAPDQKHVRGSHPTFVELGSNKPLFLHRKGSNARNGKYYTDDNPEMTIGHYSSSRNVAVGALRNEYRAALATPPDPAKTALFLKPQTGAAEKPRAVPEVENKSGRPAGGTPNAEVSQTIKSLNKEGYWPSNLGAMSHPYREDEPTGPTDGNFSNTYVGDEYDTSPYRISEPVPGISVSTYIKNMKALINYIERPR